MKKSFQTILLALTLFLVGVAQPSLSADSESKLIVLASESQAWTDALVAPLSQPVASNMRQNLLLIKEGIVDEGKIRPLAAVETYRSAYQLVVSLVGLMEYREAANKSQGSDWVKKSVALRKAVDAQYSTFRELLRKNPELVSLIHGPETPVTPVAIQGPITQAGALISKPNTATSEVSFQVLVDQKPVNGAHVFVAEGQAQGEEGLIAQGETDDGKFSFPASETSRYNIYVAMDGYKVAVRKSQSPVHMAPIILSVLPGGKAIVARPDAGLSLFGDGVTDIVPVRANQGSPVYQWLFAVGGNGTAVNNGTKFTSGQFWAKQGAQFKVTRDKHAGSCKFVDSVARKVAFVEYRAN